MEQKWDFMRQVIGQMECVVSDYDAFCDAAMRLEELDINVCHDDYGDRNPFGMHLNAVEFPQDYIILHNIADAYVRAVLSDTAFYRKWHYFLHDALRKDLDRDFWLMPQEDRKKYLMKCRALYEGIAVIKKAQLIIRDWDCLACEMGTYAGDGSIAEGLKTFSDLLHYKNAKVFEVNGCEGGFKAYIAMSRNRLLLVTCGCWQ